MVGHFRINFVVWIHKTSGIPGEIEIPHLFGGTGGDKIFRILQRRQPLLFELPDIQSHGHIQPSQILRPDSAAPTQEFQKRPR